MDWAMILVIILAVALAIFLILAIILVALLIKISKQIKSVADTAQRAAFSAEKTVSNISRASSPAYVGKFVSSYFKKMKK